MWDSESESVAGRDYDNGLLSSNKHGVQTDRFEQRGKSWFVATDIPSDFLVLIGDFSFHLHKYPLLSRSGKMNRIIYDSREVELSKVLMDDIPGGAEAFELAAKFCYGIAVDLTATNISGLRCAAEYLEMTEDLEEGNLIFKTEAFLSYVVLSSWRDSIVVLKSCEKLSPWAENLQIVRRCSESIAWKACANPKGIRWQYTGKPMKVSSPSWNEMKDSSPSRSPVPPDWWYEDVSILRIDHFVRVITAIKVKGMRYEMIGAAITHYATKSLPGLIKEGTGGGLNEEGSSSGGGMAVSGNWKGGLHMIVAGNKEDHSSITQARDQRMIIESLISIIPPQKDSVSCSFLLQLLRMANLLKVAPALVTELEKRVGMQFEQATLADLLIPCYNKTEAMYDVDLVQRLLEHFLIQEQMDGSSPGQHERKRLCRVMDCQKLSMDACMHAAQNERLPLRVVVQVLFSEQVKISNAIASTSIKDTNAGDSHYQPMVQNRKTLLEGTPQSFQEGWAAAKKDINTLKFELETVKTKYLELQNEMENLQRQFDKVTKPKQQSAWTSGWKKLSKMTKMSTLENNDVGNQSNVAQAARKNPRRWRNSIS
ncbi:BTB/POZ fold [Cynara cardunculus var. scolymus]|uniref:BTB/POZ fold n=1 Tax=Cynara cardunculus var. scolymus TaxID=59895 RepID=A0A103YKU3_CYNCS|nr:BTB/POZ fold [Cynara cardunculus var. scolymus]